LASKKRLESVLLGIGLAACVAHAQSSPAPAVRPRRQSSASIQRATTEKEIAPVVQQAPAATVPVEKAATPTTTPQGPSEEQRKEIDRLRRDYEEGMRRYSLEKTDGSATNFAGVVHTAEELEHGGALFEQRPDGRWQYRKDEVSELYALAAFRLAQAEADLRPSHEKWGERAERDFCIALEARPDVILPLVKKEGLSAQARRIFDRVIRHQAPSERRRGHSCYVKGGWRSVDSKPPFFSNPADFPVEYLN
jgi:hypothetical protein